MINKIGFFLHFLQDVVISLRDKLCLNVDEHFNLVLEHLKSAKRNKLTLLDPDETVARVRFISYIFIKYTLIHLEIRYDGFYPFNDFYLVDTQYNGRNWY